MKSLDVILNLSPHVIHPGHGPVVTEAVEKVTEYIKHRNTREKQVRFMASNIQYIVMWHGNKVLNSRFCFGFKFFLNCFCRQILSQIKKYNHS